MSSSNIYNALDADSKNALEAYLAAKEYKAAREFLANMKPDDVNVLIAEHKAGLKGKQPVPKPIPATPLPTGADDIKSMVGSDTGSSFVKVPSEKAPVDVKKTDDDVTEQEIRAMWTVIESDATVLDPEIVNAFKYQGFNPDAVLKSLLKAKKKLNMSNGDFLKDISILCALAVIKGSVTDKNIQKMTDKGKAQYDVLEKRYSIVRGGGKGKPAEVITVARIAAAFPGKVVQLIQSGQVPGRDFIGELHTHKLPGVLKHQALAACVPQGLAERSKTFILDLVTAFSVDQTKTISKTKDTVSDLIEKQKQFTNVSHSGVYPSEQQRVIIFKTFTWNDLFPQILPVATHIKTKWNDFSLITQAQFLEDLAKV